MELIKIDFESQDVRVILDADGTAWFVAKDVCDILGYANSPDAISSHCKIDGIAKRDTIDSLGRKQSSTVINEGNLYRLILKSKKPEAERFEAKVCDEILPTIRKTGRYETAPAFEIPKTYAGALLLAAQLEAEKEALELKVAEQAPKVQYCEEVLLSETGITTEVIAKELNMTAQALNQLLHKIGVQYKTESGVWVLYKQYQNAQNPNKRRHADETRQDRHSNIHRLDRTRAQIHSR